MLIKITAGLVGAVTEIFEIIVVWSTHNTLGWAAPELNHGVVLKLVGTPLTVGDKYVELKLRIVGIVIVLAVLNAITAESNDKLRESIVKLVGTVDV